MLFLGCRYVQILSIAWSTGLQEGKRQQVASPPPAPDAHSQPAELRGTAARSGQRSEGYPIAYV